MHKVSTRMTNTPVYVGRRERGQSVGMVLAPTYRMLEDATIPALKEIGYKHVKVFSQKNGCSMMAA